MTITVNGQPRSTRAGLTVADLVEELTGVRVTSEGGVPDGTTFGIAVAVNSVVIHRAGWARQELADRDVVEIVSATQGG
ncbi:MAG TPA: sulfur carrier protein ThiS [Humibacter sp.]|jgi:sulfur carrier protein|nr:sulfur carrier protein ThiS [Humibacter sp.]